MKLGPYGRDFYRVTATTDPQVTVWEASFDGGTTWVAGAPDTTTPPTANTWEWLVAGEHVDNSDLAPGELAGVITRSMKPEIRGIDFPVILNHHQEVPQIDYKTA